jgi:hypothetical protein
VSLIAAVLGVLAMTVRGRTKAAQAAEPVVAELEVEREAA